MGHVARWSPSSCSTPVEDTTTVADADAEASVVAPIEPLSPPEHSVEQVMRASKTRSMPCEADAPSPAVGMEDSPGISNDVVDSEMTLVVVVVDTRSSFSRCSARTAWNASAMASETSDCICVTIVDMLVVISARRRAARALLSSHSAGRLVPWSARPVRRRCCGSSANTNARSRRRPQADLHDMAERLESKPSDVGKKIGGLYEISGGFLKKIVVDLAEIDRKSVV